MKNRLLVLPALVSLAIIVADIWSVAQMPASDLSLSLTTAGDSHISTEDTWQSLREYHFQNGVLFNVGEHLLPPQSDKRDSYSLNAEQTTLIYRCVWQKNIWNCGCDAGTCSEQWQVVLPDADSSFSPQ